MRVFDLLGAPSGWTVYEGTLDDPEVLEYTIGPIWTGGLKFSASRLVTVGELRGSLAGGGWVMSMTELRARMELADGIARAEAAP